MSNNKENGSDCYMLLLDASKAFDRVEYVKLFSALRERKFIWNLFNSDCKLFDQIVKHSLRLFSTTLGENIRYFMYKYGICMSDWNKPISVLNHKILSYV